MVTKVKAPSYTAQHKAASKLKPTIVIVEDVTPKPTMAESIHADVKDLFAKYKVAVPSTTAIGITTPLSTSARLAKSGEAHSLGNTEAASVISCVSLH